MPTKRIRNGTVSWEGRFRDPGGTQHSATFATRRDAKAWEDENTSAIRKGVFVDPAAARVTVGDLVQERIEHSVNPSTKTSRKQLLANLGELEHVPVRAVRPSMVRDWLKVLEEGRPWADGQGLAPSTVELYAAILHGVFTQAVNDDIVLRHPMRGVTVSRATQRVEREDIPTPHEVALLIDTAKTTSVGTGANLQLARIITILADTGLRSGELAGLRVRNVDFLRQELHVVEQIGQRTGEHAPLKSERSRRTVPLGPHSLAAFDEQLKENPRRPSETVFSSSTGRPYRSSALGAQFKRVTTRAGVTTTLHALRHFYASRLIAAGVSVVVVQRMLGHASPATTLGFYGHLWPGENESVREILWDFCGISDEKHPPGNGVSAGQSLN